LSVSEIPLLFKRDSNPAGRTTKKRQVVVQLKPLPAFFVLLAGFEPSRQVEAQPKSASGGLSVSEIPLFFKRGSNPAPDDRDFAS
jgi:hypothetical protein